MDIKARLKNKKIALLGLGVENLALLKYLSRHRVRADITICDRRENIACLYRLPKMPLRWRLGREFNERLYEYDILFRSPGWPLFCPGIREARRRNRSIAVTSPIRLFLELCPTKTLIGVTGSKGKGTTASLIAAIIKASGRRVWLGGNIGIAPFEFLGRIRPSDAVVLEFSSFQLEDFDRSPRIAVWTNFFSEHLAPADPLNPNYHPSLAAYWKAKVNILAYQGAADHSVLNGALRKRSLPGRARRIFFGRSDTPSRLVGDHNRENIAAAEAVAKILSIPLRTVSKAVGEFRGLEHRIEMVKKERGVAYYDDSFATTPESSIIALRSFAAPVILICGGAEKNSDFRQWAREVKRRVRLAICLTGEATPRMIKELERAGCPGASINLAASMEEAVRVARGAARPGDIVLMSPACASFGLFKNYKERGERFRSAARGEKNKAG